MGTLQIQEISLAYGERDILTSASFTLSHESRTALAGLNGSGKSTLMKIIAGIIPADSGTITSTKGFRVSYLPQSGILLTAHTILEEVDKAYSRFSQLAARQKEIETTLSYANEHDSTTATLLHELHDIQETLYNNRYYYREAEMQQVLKGLGFVQNDFKRPCAEFSGGWQMRIALARILLERPDMLLLDEPTNYLDVEARVWLKNFLQQYHGGLLIVSHDKYFLDQTVREVFEIFQGGITRYSGNYSDYQRQREANIEAVTAAYYRQQEEIKKTEQFIERFRYKATKAAQVQSRIKFLEKIEKITLPVTSKRLALRFPPAPHSGKDMCTLQQLGKSYGNHTIFSELSLYIGKGDRISITGKNGAGKSTLLRILAGVDSNYTGSIALGTGVNIGYFPQDAENTLDPNLQVLEELGKDAPYELLPKLRSYLGSFLFSDDDVYKQVNVLSGGEKSRLALLKLLLRPVNLLILDEPTNHLDIASKDVLLEALRSFDGTLIFVSHDIYFIEGLANRILYLSEQGPELFNGDYAYFSWKLEQREAYSEIGSHTKDNKGLQEQLPKGHTNKTQFHADSLAENSAAHLSHQERNKIKNRIKAIEREEEQVLGKLEKVEQLISECHENMGKQEYYTDGDKMQELLQTISGFEAEYELLSSNWDALVSELQILKEQFIE